MQDLLKQAGRARRPRPQVVVVSSLADRHAGKVMAALRRSGARPLLVDTARFPRRLGLRLTLGPDGSGWDGTLRGRWPGALDPSRVSAVWWRRAEPYALRLPPDDDAWSGVFCACDAALTAFWRSLAARWVNDPDAEDAAEHKPSQLALASRLGFTVPRTCVTNDPAVARAFLAERPDGETIHKKLATVASLWSPTRVARPGDRKLLASLQHLPVILQERVPAAADVRVTVVGDEVFPAEIDYPGGRHALDWRIRPQGRRMRLAKLPPPVESKVRRLVRELGLVYAALDLRRRPDGELVFIEVNPSGEFLFVEEATGHPIAAALACLLARGRVQPGQ